MPGRRGWVLYCAGVSLVAVAALGVYLAVSNASGTSLIHGNAPFVFSQGNGEGVEPLLLILLLSLVLLVILVAVTAPRLLVWVLGILIVVAIGLGLTGSNVARALNLFERTDELQPPVAEATGVPGRGVEDQSSPGSATGGRDGSLGKQPHPAVFDSLIQAVGDANPSIQEAAIEALAQAAPIDGSGAGLEAVGALNGAAGSMNPGV